MADIIITQDPTKPGVNKLNGPTMTNGKMDVSGLAAGSANPNDVLTFTGGIWAPVPPAGVESASNLGAGAGVFASKVGTDFQFKSLIAGSNITLTPTATDITIAASGAGGSIAVIEHQLPSGTDGGSSVSGSWQTHALNTEVTDPDGIAILAANQITLAPGTYRVWGWSTFYLSSICKNRIQNITGGTTLIFGPSGLATPAGGVSFQMPFWGRFTVAAAQLLELQYRVSTAQASTGLGNFTGFDTEIYASVLFIKE